MPRNTSFVLSDHFTDFIDHAVESGRDNARPAMWFRAGLRLLEEEEEVGWSSNCGRKLKKGEESRYVEDFDIDTFLAEKNAKNRA